jgi:membrane-bound serine protease (ClpP class)
MNYGLKQRHAWVGLIMALMLLFSMAPAVPQDGGLGKTFLVEIDGAIGPVTQELIIRGIEDAQDAGAQMVILQMNTPGGLDHSTREIIKAILDSRIPVITYVSPQGSRAASAGTYILYASHIAAMAPATNLGAATPVQFGGLPKFTPPSDADKDTDNESQADSGSTMEKKLINDSTAYIKGLAKLRNRNEQWAESAVRQAASLTAEEALELQVIDLIADDFAALFSQLNGRQVMVKGQTVTLNTEGLVIERVEPDWRSRLLAIITNPNITYILLLVGIYGLIIEFSNPGFILPGVAGSISLLLAFYALQVLPVNYAGLVLVGVGLAFIVAEIFVTSGGILGIGGVIAFTIGSIMLFDDDYLAVSLPLIGGTALAAGGFMLWILDRFVKLRKRQVVSGTEYMIGHTGTVMADFSSQGRVKIEGESWMAESVVPVTAGQQVRVKAVNHLVLIIEPVNDNPVEE